MRNRQHEESEKEETVPYYQYNLSAQFKVPGLTQISLNMGLQSHPDKYGDAGSWKTCSLRAHPQDARHLAAWRLKRSGDEMGKAMLM